MWCESHLFEVKTTVTWYKTLCSELKDSLSSPTTADKFFPCSFLSLSSLHILHGSSLSLRTVPAHSIRFPACSLSICSLRECFTVLTYKLVLPDLWLPRVIYTPWPQQHLLHKADLGSALLSLFTQPQPQILTPEQQFKSWAPCLLCHECHWTVLHRTEEDIPSLNDWPCKDVTSINCIRKWALTLTSSYSSPLVNIIYHAVS